MKVVINTLAAAGAQTGGGYTILSNLLPRLVEIDGTNKYCLIVSEQNWDAFRIEAPNVSYVVLPNWIHRNPLRIFVDNVYVPLLIRSERADLLFSPNDHLPPYVNCPTVVGAFNLLYYEPDESLLWETASLFERLHRRARQLYYRNVTPSSLKRATRIMAISEETRRVILKEVPGLEATNVEVVYPGIPRALLAARKSTFDDSGVAGAGAARPFVLSTSAISPYKNFDVLIRAYARLVEQEGLPHTLVIVGRCYYTSYGDALKELAVALGVGDRVSFRGFVPLEELARLYEQAAVFVLLSSCESFGFPALEAMAFGTPVITSNVSSLREVVGSGGLVVDPRDLDAVCRAIGSVLSDGELGEELSRRAKARSEFFSWDSAAASLAKLFRSASLG